jgi:N-acetylneuraminic acid mutarotase
MYAATAILGDALYVIGGWDPEAPGTGGTFKDEVWRLNLDTNEWQELNAMPGGPASRHTAVTVGDQIVVQTYKGTLVLKDGVMREQPTTGDSPVGFSMASAVALDDHTMLHIFGSTREQGMTADVYSLDTRTWTWTKLSAFRYGDVPGPRASAAAAKLDDNSVLVFGGAGLGGDYDGGKGLRAFDEMYKLTVRNSAENEPEKNAMDLASDFFKGTSKESTPAKQGAGAPEHALWEKVEADPRPAPRVAASLTPLQAGPGSRKGKPRFLLQGGWNPKTGETYSEPAVFDMH